MLACVPISVKRGPVRVVDDTRLGIPTWADLQQVKPKGDFVADVHIQDGIIRITELDIQDPKAAAVLAAYPQVRWAEITRRAVKIGLGYLKGGEKD